MDQDQCITFNVSTAGVEDTDLAEQTERLLHALQTVTVVRLRQAGGKQREGARCSAPCVGPVQVTTVDKYQGQQNEYVLLSLVRTRAVGHVRDVRRLVVAMSRARLGLYIFGRLPLFANCYELQPTMAQLVQRPTQLALHPAEYWQVGSLHRAVLCRSGSDAGTQALCISMKQIASLAYLRSSWQCKLQSPGRPVLSVPRRLCLSDLRRREPNLHCFSSPQRVAWASFMQ